MGDKLMRGKLAVHTATPRPGNVSARYSGSRGDALLGNCCGIARATALGCGRFAITKRVRCVRR